MAHLKNIDADGFAILLAVQVVLASIITLINAMIAGVSFTHHPEVIAWYYDAASIIFLVFYFIIGCTIEELTEAP